MCNTTTHQRRRFILRIEGDLLEDARRVLSEAIVCVTDGLVSLWEDGSSEDEAKMRRRLRQFMFARSAVGERGRPVPGGEQSPGGHLYLEDAVALHHAAKRVIRYCADSIDGYGVGNATATNPDTIAQVEWFRELNETARRLSAAIGGRL